MTNIGGEPGRNAARALLGDILNANLDQPAELDALRDWVRHALRFGKRRDSARGDRRDALFGRLSRARIDYRARKHSRTFNHAPFTSMAEAIIQRHALQLIIPTKRATP